ncbi:hypothetical protein [Chelativorans sp. YIM 93263]|uniref:hypothetical protein n=1 Tax=Chelativorans sp. YIM 93263 TaxID=2906648 RepID=UPI0023791937|nr:hypothetical protein [Chelativorans sp. YIM 93263]
MANDISALAQDADATPVLSIELNGAEPTERGCRLTFVVKNQLEQDIDRAAYEVALFGKDGLVKKLTALDFQAFPAGQTKVRQFDLADLDCGDLGRVLINGVTACEGADEDACMARLETAARGEIAFGR